MSPLISRRWMKPAAPATASGRSTGLAITLSQRVERGARALVLHEQPDDLAGRRERAAAPASSAAISAPIVSSRWPIR